MSKAHITQAGISRNIKTMFEGCNAALKKADDSSDNELEIELTEMQKTGSYPSYTCKLVLEDTSVEFDEVLMFTENFSVNVDPRYLDYSSMTEFLSEVLRQTAIVTFDGSDKFGKMNIELKSPIIDRRLNASVEFKDAQSFAVPVGEEIREMHGITS